MHASIFAGNPRVSVQSDGTVLTETQPSAFRKAMAMAAAIRKDTKQLPYICLGFDHAGSFTTFTKDDLSRSRQKRPRSLQDLKDEIIKHFAETADYHDISLGDIDIIREGAVISQARGKIASGKIADTGIHCEVIGTEFLHAAAKRSNPDQLVIFNENKPWSETAIFVAAVHRFRQERKDIDVVLKVITPP